ncbi:methyltransferase domain-containing protein [Bradyrhizobium sp. 33ap4]|uniref:methyltransferase domain-containing protein n=1 Tax=Bradyrhizobium sp. 33ap4 TaxID=3061630 RepID=UPI00292DB616|nr:methyltransferase domain-containing protein [Bradyrhizobium sp. 33ap4]
MNALIDDIGPTRPVPSILDIGSAYGTNLAVARQKGWQCFGVESSAHARKVARERQKGVFITEKVEDIPPHQFDLVLMLDVLQHLADPYALFYTLFANGQITPETVVVVTTPNARSWDALANPVGWQYRDPPSYLTFFSGLSLQILFGTLRFTDVTLTGQRRLDRVSVELFSDEASEPNDWLSPFAGLQVVARGSDFSGFMQERFVPGTWSELAAYEHLPRYAFAKSHSSGKRILDFGCGTGYGAAAMSKAANHVLAVDLNEGALEFARRQHKAPNLSFERVADLCAGFTDQQFDRITCFEVIEHLDAADQITLLDNFRRILKDDGLLFISTPNPEVTKRYGENPYHLKELSAEEFRSLIDERFANKLILDETLTSGTLLTSSSHGIFGRNTVNSSVAVEPMFDGSYPELKAAAWLCVCSGGTLPIVHGRYYADNRHDYVVVRTDALQKDDKSRLEIYDHSKRADEYELALRSQPDLTVLLEQNRRLQRDGDAASQAHSLALQQIATLSSERDALIQRTVEATRERDEVMQAHNFALEQMAGLSGERDELLQRVIETTRERVEIMQVHNSALEQMAALSAERDALVQRIVETTRERDEATHVYDSTFELVSNLTKERDEALQVREELAAKCNKLERDLSSANAAAQIIQNSIRWRTLNRIAPLFPLARPLLAARRRILRGAVRSAARSANEQVETFDLLKELTLAPRWNRVRNKYELVVDEEHRSWQDSRQGNAKYFVDPYIVELKKKPVPGKERPKILHVIPNVYVGGSTQLVKDIVEYTSDVFDHEVLTSALWPAGAHVGLKVHHLTLSEAEKFSPLIADIQPDIVHVHYWGLTDDLWYFAVMSALDAVPDAKVIENVNTPIAPLIHPRIGMYAFVSEYVRREFGSSVTDEQATVVHPGIDLSRFTKRYCGLDAENAIGMVYRLEPDKLRLNAIDLFIEIVKRRPRTAVYIIGGGSFLESYLRRTIEAGVRANFRFTGYVPYEKLPEWYDQFSVFVAPVWSESFGQVAPFAMSKQLAVGGFRTGALPEILGSEALLGDSIEETARLIVALLNDGPRKQMIGSRNKERARTLFSVEHMAEKYADLYSASLRDGREMTDPITQSDYRDFNGDPSEVD